MIFEWAGHADFVGFVFNGLLYVSFRACVHANVGFSVVESSAFRCAVQAGDCLGACDNVLRLRGAARVRGGLAVRVSCAGYGFNDWEVKRTFSVAAIRSFDVESNAIRDTC